MLLLIELALADDPTSLVDVPPATPASAPAEAAAPPPPAAVPPPPEVAPPVPGNLTPPGTLPNPLTMRLAGFHDAPAELRFGKGPTIVHRYAVVDGSGPLSVAEIAARLGDTEVQKRRKQEVTVASVIGGIGLATAASMLAVHSIEEVNNDPVLEPVTAIAGVVGFVVSVGSFGSALQGNQRPWVYWTPEELQPKLDAANATLPLVK